MGEKQQDVLRQVEQFITKYATLAADHYKLPIALWCAATHIWDSFDCLGYLVITARVKRAGKTRLMELCKMVSSNGRTFSPDSPASMFRALADGTAPAMFVDEAEKLNQEQHPAREFLNKGYKRGQTITRFVGGEVVDYESFCPKCFVLIGDTYDTLRDRAIVVTMRRRSPVEAAAENKYRSSIVEPEGTALREQLHEVMEQHKAAIETAYAAYDGLPFLNDRDEELWLALFAIAKVLCPNRVDELTRAAVDIATEKTAPRAAFHELLDVEEKKADDAEDQILLLRDMMTLCGTQRYLASADLVEKLKAIPTSKWRMFRGVGLTNQDIGTLFTSLRITSKPIRISKDKGAKGAVIRGYLRADMLAAAKLVGLR